MTHDLRGGWGRALAHRSRVPAGVLLVGLVLAGSGGCDLGACSYEIRRVRAEGTFTAAADTVQAEITFYQTRGDRSRRDIDWRISTVLPSPVAEVRIDAPRAGASGGPSLVLPAVFTGDVASAGTLDVFDDRAADYDEAFTATVEGRAELVLTLTTGEVRVVPLVLRTHSPWDRPNCS